MSPFDAKAMDMFKIVAMQSRKPMHFFPMAMFTHQVCPFLPPSLSLSFYLPLPLSLTPTPTP